MSDLDDLGIEERLTLVTERLREELGGEELYNDGFRYQEQIKSEKCRKLPKQIHDRELSLEKTQLKRTQLERTQLERTQFWKSCCMLALGQDVPLSGQYLDYASCRGLFGNRAGVYLCLLYAQLYSSHELYGVLKRGNVLKELTCVNRELLAQVLLIYRQQDPPDEIRDALYWFFGDYCDLFVQMHLELIKYAGISDTDVRAYGIKTDDAAVFGGPALISSGKCHDARYWEQHTWDCGLYLGKRFEERFMQAVKRNLTGINPDVRRLYAGLFVKKPDASGGFILTDLQKELFSGISGEILTRW